MLVNPAGRRKVAGLLGLTLRTMTNTETSHYVRLHADLLVEVRDGDALTGGALRLIARDDRIDPTERARAELAVKQDTAEALAYLVDPFDLVREVPGIDLLRASWSSEEVAEAEYDPEGTDWDEDDDDGGSEDAGGDLR
jgi:hypothetical protein